MVMPCGDDPSSSYSLWPLLAAPLGPLAACGDDGGRESASIRESASATATATTTTTVPTTGTVDPTTGASTTAPTTSGAGSTTGDDRLRRAVRRQLL